MSETPKKGPSEAGLKIDTIQDTAHSLGVLQIVGLLPTRLRTLVLLATLGLTPNLKGCSWEDGIDTDSDPILLSHTEGGWDFNMYGSGKARVNDDFGQTLYHFIQGKLKEEGAFKGMNEEERLDLINAIIYFCERLNTENIHDFQGINGRELYFPDSIAIIKSSGTHLLELDFVEEDTEKDGELVEALKDRDLDTQTLNGQLDDVLEKLAQEYQRDSRDSGENAMHQLQAFDRLMTRTGTKNYHEILMNFNVASEVEMSRYKGKTAEQIQDQIDQSSASLELSRVLKTKMYEEFIEIIKALTPQQIEEKRILRGTVLDGGVSFYNLQEVWEYKKTKKGRSSDRAAYDIVIEELKGKDNTITLESWLKIQQEACAYFQKHGTRLGYSSELVEYMTPAVILSVMHAEFFSELSGRAYLDVLPIALESGNLAYGPAVGDPEFSAGEVQLLRGTLERILNRDGGTLRKMQEDDGAFTFLVPQKKPVSIKKKRKNVIVQKYDDREIVDAMIMDSPSHAFYNILTVADHVELGLVELFKDPNFKKAWASAPERQKYSFMASFAAMAINNGRGGPKYQNGAYEVGRILPRNVEAGSSLEVYTAALPQAAKESTSGKQKRRTVSTGARKGLEAMREILRRIEELSTVDIQEREEAETPEVIVHEATVAPRVELLVSYQPILDRAAADGFNFSSDPRKNQAIYEAAKRRGVEVPPVGDGYCLKPNSKIDATLDRDALVVLENFAREFKQRSGGYSFVVTDLLRSPEQQDAISISKGTHTGGSSGDFADGWFVDPNGNLFSWADFSGKSPRRGDKADLIEQTLRPIMIQLLEEYQGKGLMLVFDETERGAKARGKTRSGGHWHVYFPKTS